MPERDLARLLAGLAPHLDPDPWVFVTHPAPLPADLSPLMTFREEEGLTLSSPPPRRAPSASPTRPVFRRITLGVHSSLEAVGLTAAVAAALTAAGISANVVAAFHHDHVFVPADRAEDGPRLPARLQATA